MGGKKFLISESPTSSYQKNGQGGSINLVLRQSDQGGDGIWGSAGIDLAYPSSVSPQLHLGYRSKKFYVSALALGDIGHQSNNSESLTYIDDQFDNLKTSSYNRHTRSQLVNVLMLYKPTAKDQINLNLSESYKYNKATNAPGYDEAMATFDKDHSTTLKAQMSYNHNFSRSALKEKEYYTNQINQ